MWRVRRRVARSWAWSLQQQLNKALESTGVEAPPFSEEESAQFCLVAIIAGKEYSLQDDLCPPAAPEPMD